MNMSHSQEWIDQIRQEVLASLPEGHREWAERHSLHGSPQSSKLASLIDHTLLRPDATEQEIETLCKEAVDFRFTSVCVHSCWVEYCAQRLGDTPVRICSVAGFPFGTNASSVKAFEASEAFSLGAHEIDMVINPGFLKGKNYAAVMQDIRAVVDIAHGQCVKVIIETSLLFDR